MSKSFHIRRRHGWSAVIIAVLSVLAFCAQQQGWLDSASKMVQHSQPGLYSVTHFVDGDTIEVTMNGTHEKVRFVGVDTPETHKPNTPVQCYGSAAAAFTKNTIGTNQVRLVSDMLSTDRDRYDRLLRYVYLPDGRLVNKLLIAGGYGFYYPYFPFSKSAEFSAAEQMAMGKHAGLWGNCHPTPTDSGGWVSNNAS